VDRPGTSVVVAAGPGTNLDVYETVRVSGTVSGLNLQLPDLAADADLTVSRLQVTDLSAVVDGVPVEPRQASGADRLWTLTGPSGAPIRQAVLRYRLSGAVVLGERAALPGRGLLLVTPLTAGTSMAAAAPVVVRAENARVLAVTCPDAPPARQLCGSDAGGSWVAELPSSGPFPLAVFQVNLPQP
jgi:hypothetical protein